MRKPYRDPLPQGLPVSQATLLQRCLQRIKSACIQPRISFVQPRTTDSETKYAPVPSVLTNSKSWTLSARELRPRSLFLGFCCTSSGGSTLCWSAKCATNCLSCSADCEETIVSVELFALEDDEWWCSRLVAMFEVANFIGTVDQGIGSGRGATRRKWRLMHVLVYETTHDERGVGDGQLMFSAIN